MEPTGLNIIVYVSDMERSVAFYRDKLGLAVVSHPKSADLGKEEWVSFDAGAGNLSLHAGGCDVEERRRAVQMNLAVNFLEATRDECNSRGANFGDIENPHPGVNHCSTTDPDGLRVFLSQAQS